MLVKCSLSQQVQVSDEAVMVRLGYGGSLWTAMSEGNCQTHTTYNTVAFNLTTTPSTLCQMPICRNMINHLVCKMQIL